MSRSLPALQASQRWLAAAVIAGVLTGVVAFFLPGGYSGPALMAGGLTALANALAARWINRRAMGVGRQAFRHWGVGGNILRILMLLGILTGAIFSQRTVRASFFASMFTGFFVYMTVEIIELFRLDSGKRKTV